MFFEFGLFPLFWLNSFCFFSLYFCFVFGLFIVLMQFPELKKYINNIYLLTTLILYEKRELATFTTFFVPYFIYALTNFITIILIGKILLYS